MIFFFKVNFLMSCLAVEMWLDSINVSSWLTFEKLLYLHFNLELVNQR